MEYRIEKDSMGQVKVPSKALYSAQTQRAIENFPISGQTLSRYHIKALGQIKRACAIVNGNLNILDKKLAEAIVDASEEVINGNCDEDFPIDVFQTGSGTSSNMNANEVIANLACKKLKRKVHPNDHVNMCQSSNDVFPASIHIACVESIRELLLPNLMILSRSLFDKANQWKNVVKSGRTHLMDATPITLGQEFSGYEAQISKGVERIEHALSNLKELPLGGTAVGTGVNTPKNYSSKVISEINKNTGIDFKEAMNHFESQACQDSLVEISSALRILALSLVKVCNDLRWMGSGPRAGLSEIFLPDLQPGSSIMPGKVNPVLPEATIMVCAQVIGNDEAVSFAAGQGNFDLLVMLPVMGKNILESISLLANVTKLLAEKCINGIVANEKKCRELAESSPSIVTALNAIIGYENASKIAKYSLANSITIKQATIELGFVKDGKITMEELDAALDVYSMIKPNL